jgi:hypothetical protein
LKIVYFVHDLNDAAVRRRLDMFACAAATVTLLGFRRGDTPVSLPDAVQLGHTRNGRMFARARAVVAAWLLEGRWGKTLGGADMIVARNLECLVLAALHRRRRAPGAVLVYECLDIHRLMLGDGTPGWLLRRLEGGLLRACDALMVSSPAFIEQYFKPRHAQIPRHVLIENTLLAAEAANAAPVSRADGPPWRIGWFGIIRCARSLELLAGLVRALPGLVEVDIRGRPARDVLPGFDAVVAATPGLSFHGAYDRKLDLPHIYGCVHFTWAADFYEAGGNSDWLLPNRLYEGGVHGPVALAVSGSQTARWLEAHAAGVVLKEPMAESLYGWFAALSGKAYADYFAAMRKIPLNSLVYDDEACNRKVRELIGST